MTASNNGASRPHRLTTESFLDGRISIIGGDCLRAMPTLKENSIDACVCDPPYHLQSITKRFAKTGRTDKTSTSSGPHQRTARGFMNTIWDGGDVAFRPKTWAAVLRVLKPGAYVVACCGTRTGHRVACAMEDAGFIIHPFIAWAFAQGFPKAHRIAASGLSDLDRATEGWGGWRYGTQSLKPAIEPIYVGQKPFEDGLNGWQNIQKWGTGALNIDACRVFTDDDLNVGACKLWSHYRNGRDGELSADRTYVENGSTNFAAKPGRRYTVKRLKPGATLNKTGGNWRPEEGGVEYHGELKPGRWPSNLCHDGSDEVVMAFPDSPGQLRAVGSENGAKLSINTYGDYGPRNQFEPRNDSGSAARFFYCAKGDADDRLGSKHPTVKPLDLMEYLCRLVTPPRGLILDPFAGTGTTGEAAFREGMRAILIEREVGYQEDIRRRMRLVMSGPDERRRESIKEKMKDRPVNHGPLFGGTDAT